MRNNTPHSLARIPLRWMIRECFRCNTGIIFDAIMLQQIGLNVGYDSNETPILREVPSRVHQSPHEPGDADKTRPGLVSSLSHGLAALLAYPFVHVAARLNRGKYPEMEQRVRRCSAPSHDSRDWSYRLRDDLPGNHEAEEERQDALSPLNDQLKANWWWNILEYVPVRVKKERAIIEEIESITGYKWM